jgi:hypothetical protein
MGGTAFVRLFTCKCIQVLIFSGAGVEGGGSVTGADDSPSEASKGEAKAKSMVSINVMNCFILLYFSVFSTKG